MYNLASVIGISVISVFITICCVGVYLYLNDRK